MKNTLSISFVLCLFSYSFAQVLNDAQTLREGIAGVYVAGEKINGNEHFMAGFDIGISRSSDIETRLRVGPNIMRVMINVEFALTYKPNISIALGGHYQKNSSGADAILNISFPLSRFFTAYTGVNGDVNFSNGTTSTPAWGFVGINTFFFKGLEFFIEYNPSITTSATSLIGSGLRVYL